MNAALATKPMPQLAAQYGPMRPVVHSTNQIDIPSELQETYTFSLLAGKELRKSLIKRGRFIVLSIDFVEYIDPVSQLTRYAVHYWAFPRTWAVDHSVRMVAERAYEDAVRAEFAAATLTPSHEQATRGLASFYTVTDVI
jgi:hypothetical protein